MAEIRAEFDRIAMLPDNGWNHNNHYHEFLLKHLPRRLGHALEIGCGTGEFSRQLAERCEQVLGLDLSPEMVRIARERSAEYPNLEYQVADVMEWAFPKAQFDGIASIATLHHLPLEMMLARMRDALKPGGTLLVLDLYQAESMADRLIGGLGFPASALLRLANTGRLRRPHTPESRAAWDAHGRDEVYPTLSQVRSAYERALPGAQVRRHLLWRYSLVWRKAEEFTAVS